MEKSIIWNPFRGCHKYSEGCRYCFIHQGDIKKGIDTNLIVKTNQFDKIIKKNKQGYIVPSDTVVYLCFSADFFIEEADAFRHELWEMMRLRKDLTFIFLTKRITRFYDCVPSYWNEINNRITIGVSVEDKESVKKRLTFLNTLPIAHKNIIAQPLLEDIDLEPYLKDVERVIVGGEYHKNARPLDFNWVLKLQSQAKSQNISFEFRQTGTYLIKDGTKEYYPYSKMFKAAFVCINQFP